MECAGIYVLGRLIYIYSLTHSLTHSRSLTHIPTYTQTIVHTVPGDINAVAFSPTEPNLLAVSGAMNDIKIIDCGDYSHTRTLKVG